MDKNDPQLLSIRYLKGENASKTINLDNETDESSSESDEEEDGDDKPLEEENRFNILSVD